MGVMEDKMDKRSRALEIVAEYVFLHTKEWVLESIRISNERIAKLDAYVTQMADNKPQSLVNAKDREALRKLINEPSHSATNKKLKKQLSLAHKLIWLSKVANTSAQKKPPPQWLNRAVHTFSRVYNASHLNTKTAAAADDERPRPTNDSA